MSVARKRKRTWWAKCVLGAGLGLSYPLSFLQAEPLQLTEAALPVIGNIQPAEETTLIQQTLPDNADFAGAGSSFSFTDVPAENGNFGAAPMWCDPICRMPNFFGDVFARGAGIDQRLVYAGGGEGLPSGATITIPNAVANGPGGPFTITNLKGQGAFPNYAAIENAQFTAQLQKLFPGATFANGTINAIPTTFLLNYDAARVCLPNPTGGGAVGRNRYFVNGSPMPRDRVYFFYNHVGNFQAVCTPYNLNRYVFGVEKAFFNNLCSVEIRVPFAGTASSDQSSFQPLNINDVEFGNLGIAFKGVLLRTPTHLLSVGLGISVPTADSSRVSANGQTLLEIQNQTCLLQPLLGFSCAPNDRVYGQIGLQFDFDPTGNPVQAQNLNGQLSRIGRLNDQGYVYASGALGYWIFESESSWMTRIALQGELHYTGALGARDIVSAGNLQVADNGASVNYLNGTAGLSFRMRNRAESGIAVSFPLGSERIQDWSLFVRLNYYFGGPW